MSAMTDVFLHPGNPRCFERWGLWGTHSCDEIQSVVMRGVTIPWAFLLIEDIVDW